MRKRALTATIAGIVVVAVLAAAMPAREAHAVIIEYSSISSLADDPNTGPLIKMDLESLPPNGTSCPIPPGDPTFVSIPNPLVVNGVKFTAPECLDTGFIGELNDTIIALGTGASGGGTIDLPTGTHGVALVLIGYGADHTIEVTDSTETLLTSTGEIPAFELKVVGFASDVGILQIRNVSDSALQIAALHFDAPDSDLDCLPDVVESIVGSGGFKVTDESLSLDCSTGDAPVATGDASTGVTITSSGMGVTLPPDTQVEGGGSNELGINFAPGLLSRIEIKNAQLPTGETKTVELPTGMGTSVCIEDTPSAFIEVSELSTPCLPPPPFPDCPLDAIEIPVPTDPDVPSSVTTKTPEPECIEATYTITKTLSSSGDVENIVLEGLVHSAVTMTSPEVGGVVSLLADGEPLRADRGSSGSMNYALPVAAIAAVAALATASGLYVIRKRH